MIEMLQGVFRSFGRAFQGIFCTLREERNFRIHLVAVCLVTCFSVLYEVSWGQAVVLVILYSVVLSLELINTAVERTVDLVTMERCPLAKKAKDAAAGAVLVSAIAAVVVAVLMFRDPKHWSFVFQKISTPLGIISLFIFLLLSLFFVRGKKRK